MNDLTTTQGIVALAAAAVAVVALLFAIVLAVKLRRLRASQRVVLGAQGQRDLVAHAERLETGLVDLRGWGEEVLQGRDQRGGTAGKGSEHIPADAAPVHYDAYGEMSGQPSS